MKRVVFSAAWAVACVQALAVLSGCGGASSPGGGGGTQPQQPYIASFTAGANNIEAGTSTTLTAVFGNGSGVITPGNISVTSGVAVTVTPASTTTYTLTVTGSSGTTPATLTTPIIVYPVPVITSFTASSNQIELGSSTYLTGDFTGGTGVITGPGNFSTSVSSGQQVSVTPPATTTPATDTYTLTVTPVVGPAIAETATVTVYPVPVITSFTASPSSVVAGSNIALTAIFSGGTGVITPGNITVTSGNPVSVSTTGITTYTTTYTLTVTPEGAPPAGSAITRTTTATLDPAVTVCMSASCSGPAISSLLMGMNLAVWYDDVANASSIVPAFENAGIVALRWPGGQTSEDYHWNGNNANPKNGVAPTPSMCAGAVQDSDTNYLAFIRDLEYANTNLPNGFDVALTANYGTNPTCNGGGQPSEAANWVEYAYANGGTVSYVTVGNEPYGSWEEDLHAVPQDPATYVSAVSGPSGYYELIKNQSSSTKVGVVVDAGCTTANDCTNGWDATVLAKAAGYYDFVEYHFYAEYGNVTSDTALVQQAAQVFTYNINVIKSELATAGAAGTPIYVGEVGSNPINPGTQSWSITQGLYAGQLLGEAMNDGVARLTWWLGFGNCWGPGNNAATLYGWQNTWGADNVFSDGPSDTECTGEGPIGTMSPTAQAFNLFQYMVNAANAPHGGESTLEASVLGDTTDVRAYAATHSGGTALMLFNLNETTAETVNVSLTGTSQTSSSDVKMITYDKAIYDQSNPANTGGAVWAPATTTDLGRQTLPMMLTLQPWSMNVVIVQP
jgi:alpha-L-arabinofuranosidase